MKYLILTTPTVDHAKQMSAALWSLARPSSTGSTRYAVGHIVHPSGDAFALVLGDYTQRVDPDADVDGFVAALPIPESEKDDVRALLNGARGSRLTVAEFLPPSLAANLRTREELDADGWFPEPE